MENNISERAVTPPAAPKNTVIEIIKSIPLQTALSLTNKVDLTAVCNVFDAWRSDIESEAVRYYLTAIKTERYNIKPLKERAALSILLITKRYLHYNSDYYSFTYHSCKQLAKITNEYIAVMAKAVPPPFDKFYYNIAPELFGVEFNKLLNDLKHGKKLLQDVITDDAVSDRTPPLRNHNLQTDGTNAFKFA